MNQGRGVLASHRLWWILATALALRLAGWWLLRGSEPSIFDEKDYDLLAGNLVRWGEFAFREGDPTALRPPLYPAAVAAVYSLFGIRAYGAVAFFQILVDLGTVAAAALLAADLYDRGVAVAAAALIAFYPSLWGHDYLLLTEVLFTFLLVLGCLLLNRSLRDLSRLPLALGGLTLGLAALTRSVLQLYPPLFLGLLLSAHRFPPRRRLAACALFLAAFALPVAPWIARNTLARGAPTAVDSMGTYLFKKYAAPDLGMADANGRPGRRELRREGSGPLPAARRILIRFFKFWQVDRELVAAATKGRFGPLPAWSILLLAAWIGAYYAFLALAGTLGASALPPAHRLGGLLIASVVALICGVHSLIYGHSRYHIPLMPLVAIFAAAALVRRRDLLHPRRRRSLAIGIALAALLAGSWIVQLLLIDLPELLGGLGWG